MHNNQIVAKAEKMVSELLSSGLKKDHWFHSYEHTFSVRDAALELASAYQLPDEELEILHLACLFHDTGFTERYEQHEEVSKKIARQFLKEQAYPSERLKMVEACIEATKPEKIPESLLEKIIKDADLNNLGRKKYMTTIRNLRHEWEVFFDKVVGDEEWYAENLKFLEEHEYYTQAARTKFGPKKLKNMEKIRALSKKTKNDLISSNRSAQMIFKTALRNHIDLTSIADNKANIMLSINALIITISMPLLATNIQDNPFLFLPTSILLITCVISIIFAAMATRPIKTSGKTDLSLVKMRQTNLFFFGNFYKMDLNEYKKGIRNVLKDEEVLEESIIADLYYLGKALGSKFSGLRICYGVFMVGITATVISFAISFFLSTA